MRVPAELEDVLALHGFAHQGDALRVVEGGALEVGDGEARAGRADAVDAWSPVGIEGRRVRVEISDAKKVQAKTVQESADMSTPAKDAKPLQSHCSYLRSASLLALSMSIGTASWAQPTPPAVARIPAGSGAAAIAVNPVTNKVYVANRDDGTLTVIDDITYAVAATIDVGALPVAVDVNPATNRVYVVNQGSNSVTVLDGATNATQTVGVGSAPVALIVNPVTNKIYVANKADGTVTAIDGATNATQTFPVGLGPVAFALDTTTNKIYVANSGASTLTAIDGATNATSSILINKPAAAIAVDPADNTIYVAMPDQTIGTCAIQQIDGVNPRPFNTICISPVILGSAVAIKNNPANHDVYALFNYAHPGDQVATLNFYARPGAYGTTEYLFGPTYPNGAYELAIDPLSERWYAILGANLVVMDAASIQNNLRGAWGGTYFAIAANPQTGNVFVSENGPAPYGNNIMVLSYGADLEISTSSSPSPVITGTEVSFDISVVNHGPRSATQVVITDTLPPGASAVSCTTSAGTCTSSASGFTVSVDSLGVGSSVAVTVLAAISCTVPDQTVLTNMVSVAAVQGDPNPANNSASAPVTAANPLPVISNVAANPANLWPFTNKLIDVAVGYGVSDNCPLPAGSCALSVTDNAPAGGSAPDWVVVDSHHVRLRAAPPKGGLQRVYAIDIACSDSGGGIAHQGLRVAVSKP